MYKIIWEVVHGDKNGRKLWFPTANVILTQWQWEDAVYCLNIEVEWKLYSWVGTYQPKKWLFESHIFDFDSEIYGTEISIYIKSKIRDNRKFGSFEELISQIQKDTLVARKRHHRVLTAGSFDVTHPGHTHYLSEAKKYGEKLITIIATDENIEKIKWQQTQHKLSVRMNDVEKLWISNIVVAGSNSDPLRWIQEYKPHSICLWYDQRWPFVEKIEKELQYLNIGCQIIRIDPLKPEIYKSSLLKAKK